MKNISGTITLGGTAQVLSAMNLNRRHLFLQNNDDIDYWLNDNGDASAASPSIIVPPGSQFELTGEAARGAWSIYGATTGKAFIARED